MIDKTLLKNFTKELELIIKEEQFNNKSIIAKIVKIDENIIHVSLKQPSYISENTIVSINKIQAKILKNNKNNLIIKINNKSYFYLNQTIKINNLQQDIVLIKLNQLLNNVKDNKLSSENIETLKVLLESYENNYNLINNHVISLNHNQLEALNKSISASKFHIIKGPPGTGKTHTIVEIIKYLFKNNYRILITSHTHIAVDNILEKLDFIPNDNILRIADENKISKKSFKYHINNHIKQHPYYEKIVKLEIINEELTKQITQDNLQKPQLKILSDNDKSKNLSIFNRIISLFYTTKYIENKDNYIDNTNNNFKIQEAILKNNEEIENIKNYIIQHVYENIFIVASTVLSSSSSQLKNIHFDYMIMDEASQVPLYLSLIGLLKTNKFILIGDDKQLQPITNNLPSYLNKSIFNYMIEKYPKNYTFLNIQYRMNKRISDISSKLYYNNKLKTYPAIADNTIKLINSDNILLDNNPITFINSSNVEYYESNTNGSCCNKYESEIIISIIKSLIKNDIKTNDIGIITPYKKQKNYIKNQLTKHKLNVECDTIYRYQGREKDIIIISFCKSSTKSLNKYQKRFLSDKNQLNVSITRSKKKLIIIGDESLLSSCNNIKELLNDINIHKIYLEDFI